MIATASQAALATLVASITFVSLSASDSARFATRSAPLAIPITVTMPAGGGAAVSNAQYSSQDVFGGVLSGTQTPPSGISPLQRLANLNPPNFRIHAGTDGGPPAIALPFNATYTSVEPIPITVQAWDFTHLNALIANTIGRTSGSMMLNARYAPDNMFAGSGPMGGNGNAPGALLDQTYGQLATYMANLVRYYNTATPPAGAFPPRPASIGPIKYWEIWNEPDFSSENPRIPPSLSAPGGITLTPTTGGSLSPGTYSYRITPLTSSNQEGLASTPQNITLSPGQNAVTISWSPSTNLGRLAAAYTIYGRTGTTGARMVVVGKDNGGGLTWTDTGSITPGGAPPGSNQTAGGAVFSPLDYKKMWDVVVPAMKAVDSTIKVVGPATTNPISIGGPSVVPITVPTTGPNDMSYVDNRDYVQVLMTSVNRPDVISYHAYGGYQGAADSDASLMASTTQIAADVASNILPYVPSSIPIWHTEANLNAAGDSTNRPALSQGAAWQASLFAKLAPLGISTIHQYSYVQSPTFGMVTESGSPVPGAVEGNPYLPYWVDYWIDKLFPPGSKILTTGNVPAGFDVLAVATPPDFTKVKVLVVNRQVPATNTLAPILLVGAISSATRTRVIDSTTNLVNGPAVTNAGIVQTASVQLNGYSVGLIEFDTGVLACTATSMPAAMMALSTIQYTLSSSDGTTWQEIDPASLRLACSPTANQPLLLTGNADLWTGNAGYNQDLGIFVSDNGAPDQLLAWKESGGFAGTYSPNAAYVQYLFNMTSGHAYVFKLKWKTNKPAPGATIFAGAGSGTYSPTSLLGEALSAGSAFSSAISNTQYTLAGSNGVSWQTIDANNLSTMLSPSVNSTAVLGANADLWTANAGYNQDLGIFVSDSGGPDQLVAWKESGGFAGTYSPNAAFIKATYPMIGNHTYVFKLKWKTNINAPGATIFAAAGSGLGYSPTTLFAQALAGNPNTAVSAGQYSLASSDGSTWQPIDAALNVTVNPMTDTNSIVGGNADLWTANAGFNQDIGIFVSDSGQPDQLVAWKESGGFAGTYSPNAAFVQGSYAMTSGHTYVFKLKWKTNINAPGTRIFAAAGGSGSYSPTRLIVELTS